MQSLLLLAKNIQQQAQADNHRQILRLQGSVTWCFQQTERLIEQLQQPYFWIGQSPTDIKTTSYKTVLGQETSLLIINAIDQFDANAFAAAEGTLRGGGLLILLAPIAVDERDYFYHYIDWQFQQYDFITIKQGAPLPLLNKTLTNIVHYKPINSSEQDIAIAAIIKTVTGHRRRPLVLTANRGRGKSAALGIAAATLLNAGVNNILVCAPNKRATYTLFKHASLLLTGNECHQYSINRDKQSIQFIAPDALLANKPLCELLIIDEAAAIPVAMLESFVHHYPRVVFASTLHGYEGSGRGFALRFQKRLSEIAPQWRKCHLNTPIRWSEQDPVEHFTLNNLCLTEDTFNAPHYDKLQNLQFDILTPLQLIHDKEQLRALFSLLVIAHYQTKPSDLAMLLNDRSLHIFAIRQNKQLLGVALLNAEGGFEPEMAKQIWKGARRVQGNLVAQSLAFHSANEEVALQRFARVQRIAIHPSCQQQGIGKLFIKQLTAWATENHFDHICASFAATANLLLFWQQLNFTTLRIGTTQDSSSGTHSVIVNLPLSQAGKKSHKDIQQSFHLQLPMQLSRHLKHIEADLVLGFLHELHKTPLNVNHLISYTEGNRPFETVEYQLQQLLLNANLQCLNKQQQSLSIQKILQNNSWAEVCDKNQYTGKQQAQQSLKNAIKQLTL